MGTKTAAAAALLPYVLPRNSANPLISAVAFDAFTLFDTHTVTEKAEQLYPGKAPSLMAVWRNRQFEYSWLRCLSKTYRDFWRITGDALVYAAASLQLDLTIEKKDALMQAVMDMKFVPEAKNVLYNLKLQGLQLAILSNATQVMLQSVIQNSNVTGLFNHVISTDTIKTYKPDPDAYQLAINAFKVKKEEILFTAFGGWDAAGAKSFGYRTAWMNTGGVPPEELDKHPDFICKNLTGLADYIKKINQ